MAPDLHLCRIRGHFHSEREGKIPQGFRRDSAGEAASEADPGRFAPGRSARRLAPSARIRAPSRRSLVVDLRHRGTGCVVAVGPQMSVRVEGRLRRGVPAFRQRSWAPGSRESWLISQSQERHKCHSQVPIFRRSARGRRVTMTSAATNPTARPMKTVKSWRAVPSRAAADASAGSCGRRVRKVQPAIRRPSVAPRCPVIR